MGLMARPSNLDLLQGTLDLLVLKTLTWGRAHGYTVARWIQQLTDDVFQVGEGSLYAALHRLGERGLIESESVPGRGLGAELRATLGRQLVELGFAVVLAAAPLALDPAALLEAVQGGVERAFTYGENVICELLDPSGDGVSVRGSPRERLEDEEVERALQEVEIGRARHASHRMSMGLP